MYLTSPIGCLIYYSAMTTIRLSGEIDRNQPDPSAPTDPHRSWIGMVTAVWAADALMERTAALVKIATGRGTGDGLWGQHALVMRWIGDPPPVEVAQAVYDVVRDGGPRTRIIKHVIESQQRSEAQPSYRPAKTAHV